MAELARCEWAGSDPLMQAYHDLEWGVPLHDDRQLFELLTLEGAQAGLSWSTILRRRNGYRVAFAEFDIPTVAAFAHRDIERILSDANVVRNRQKVASTVANAQRILDIQRERDSFAAFLWSFVPNGQPIVNNPKALGELPAQTVESVTLSKALKKRGFGFVGPTICYAFMQAAGLVNDHVVGCTAKARLEALRSTTASSSKL
jgi:DNA-3-methyladenine glycosylase I